MKQKKIPLRKCTGCQQMIDKRNLLRIVKDEKENFLIDLTGKKNGRGAYICKNLSCIEKAKKNRGLERSFKASIPKEIYEEIGKELNCIV